METAFGKQIIDALYEEGTRYDAELEIFFERQTDPTTVVNERALLFVALRTLKAGGVGRVFFPSTGNFSDLWVMWSEPHQCLLLFVFSGCERIVLTPVKAYGILTEEGCCGNFEDDDIVLNSGGEE